VTFAFKFLMRAGPHKVAVSVRDDTALAESTVTARFNVGTDEVRGPGVLQGMLTLSDPGGAAVPGLVTHASSQARPSLTAL
jgi:uncharacterized protein YlxW (UPF0749 family)